MSRANIEESVSSCESRVDISAARAAVSTRASTTGEVWVWRSRGKIWSGLVPSAKVGKLRRPITPIVTGKRNRKPVSSG